MIELQQIQGRYREWGWRRRLNVKRKEGGLRIKNRTRKEGKGEGGIDDDDERKLRTDVVWQQRSRHD
jgi:hypothetical protein